MTMQCQECGKRPCYAAFYENRQWREERNCIFVNRVPGRKGSLFPVPPMDFPFTI